MKSSKYLTSKSHGRKLGPTPHKIIETVLPQSSQDQGQGSGSGYTSAPGVFCQGSTQEDIKPRYFWLFLQVLAVGRESTASQWWRDQEACRRSIPISCQTFKTISFFVVVGRYFPLKQIFYGEGAVVEGKCRQLYLNNNKIIFKK